MSWFFLLPRKIGYDLAMSLYTEQDTVNGILLLSCWQTELSVFRNFLKHNFWLIYFEQTSFQVTVRSTVDKRWSLKHNSPGLIQLCCSEIAQHDVIKSVVVLQCKSKGAANWIYVYFNDTILVHHPISCLKTDSITEKVPYLLQNFRMTEVNIIWSGMMNLDAACVFSKCKSASKWIIE